MSFDLSEYTNFYKACIRCSLIAWILLAVLQRRMDVGACIVPLLFFRDQMKAGIRKKEINNPPTTHTWKKENNPNELEM